MKKTKKNIYLAALGYEIATGNGIDRICKALRCKYVSESNAYCWIEEGRTEREIVALLRKIGYDITEGFKGSDNIKFDCTVQDED